MFSGICMFVLGLGRIWDWVMDGVEEAASEAYGGFIVVVTVGWFMGCKMES